MTTIVLADEDMAFCDNALALLRLEGHSAIACTEPEAVLSAFTPATAFIAAISLQWTSVGGHDLLKFVAKQKGAIAIFATGTNVSMRDAVLAMQIGATDVLEKPYSVEPLIQAAQSNCSNDAINTKQSTNGFDLSGLTKREREILDQLLTGRSAKTIGKQLKISSRTVEVHRRSIFRKTGVTSHATLISKLKN